MNRAVAAAVALSATSLVAAACSDPQPSPWAVEESEPATDDRTDSVPTDDPVPAPPTDDLPPQTTVDGIVVDESCLDDEDRCGRILLPQLPGDPDLVALEFRVSNEGASGRPLVVLDAGFGAFTPTAEDFPDRPLVVLGSRFTWPGGPSLSCPEWFDLDADTPDEVVAEATARCADRLAATGIDLRGSLRDQQALDVVAALRRLGITELDLVAAADRADLAPDVADAFDVGIIVLLEPTLSGSDPVAATVERLTRSLDFAWAACRSAPVAVCDPVGPIDDFLDEVAALDDAPLPFTLGLGDDDQEVDRTWLVSALHRESARPVTVAFLPTLHQALLDRDADTVSEFVSVGSANRASTDHLAQACTRLTSTPDDFRDAPAALRRDATEAIEFFAINCPEWVRGTVATPDHAPDLVVITESTADRAAIEALPGELVVQPTVGSPTHDCVAAAVAAALTGTDPATEACLAPFEIPGRTDVELVEGLYVYDDDHTVALPVPDSWTDSGFGTWWRNADPVDPTNLDVYFYFADEPEQAREEFVVEWSITEPELTEGRHGSREWLLATGGDGIDGSDLRQTVAVSLHDDAIVAMILQSDEDDHATLIESVLVPAMTEVTVVS